MNKCVFQLWEESSRDGSILPDGCSIHFDSFEHQSFLGKIYNTREDSVPDSYERIVGGTIEAFISDDLYENIIKNRSVRLSEIEKNNLISMDEILFKPDL